MRVAAAIAAALAFAALPVIVLGHATLVSSDPADGSTITTPYTLTATFAEETDPARSSLTVENSAGTQVATGTVNAAEATQMSAQLPALPDGVYTVRWTTVTPDDNGIERGTYTFNVGSTSPIPSRPVVGPGVPNEDPSGQVLVVFLIAGAVIAGILAFLILRTPRGRR